MNPKEKLQKALLAAREICEAAEKANRDFTAEERTQLQGYLEEAKSLKAAIQKAEGDEVLKKQILDLGGVELRDGQNGQAHATAAGKGKSIGEQFVEAEGYKAWIGRFPNSQIPDSSKGLMSPPVGFKTLLTGGSATSGGAFVNTDVTGIFEPLGRRPLVLRDLVSGRTTSSDTVEFVRQTSQVNAAAPTAEATAASGSSGTKPEGAMAFEKVTAAVKTIPVWVPATKRALSDAAQLRGLIDQELRADLEETLEEQVLTGDGSGENFTGILNTTNVQAQAYDTDLLTTTRKARTKVRVTGKSIPTAYLLHPNDWEKVDLLQDNEARYYFGGPMQLGTPRLWGLPVVESEAITEGTGLVGDFRKAVIWDREQASIAVSDSHSDFFIRNLVAILAEMRAAFGVIRPTAFCTIDLTA